MKPIKLLASAAAISSIFLSSISASAADMTEEKVNEIIKKFLYDNPSVIIESLQAWQVREEALKIKRQQDAVNELKDSFDDDHHGVAGNEDGDVTVVEFFDYNCPSCKMMFESVDGLIKADKNVKVVFVEYPIFGPASNELAKVGMAVAALEPEKYFEFHSALMRKKGKVDVEYALSVAGNMGMDADKIEKEAKKEKYNEYLIDTKAIGAKLQIQGTPSTIIGGRMVNSALSLDDLKAQVGWERSPDKSKE